MLPVGRDKQDSHGLVGRDARYGQRAFHAAGEMALEEGQFLVAVEPVGAGHPWRKFDHYGSTGAENAYYIDGANTTGVEFGTQGTNLNFEFIDEVQVKTGSYNAEDRQSVV